MTKEKLQRKCNNIKHAITCFSVINAIMTITGLAAVFYLFLFTEMSFILTLGMSIVYNMLNSFAYDICQDSLKEMYEETTIQLQSLKHDEAIN